MTGPVLCVLGTRPEAVKMAPVLLELTRRGVEHFVLSTGQHRELVAATLDVFGVELDQDLGIMTADQTPTAVAAKVLQGLEPILNTLRPRSMLVQGDTTTVMAAAIAGAYSQIPVAHLEAGLRTGDRAEPFPEEHNRVVTTAISDLHLAPTWGARDNLLLEGVDEGSVVVTGNTVIDALFWARDLVLDRPLPSVLAGLGADKSLILMTAHRRENHGDRLIEVCEAVRQLVTDRRDVAVLYPVHPSPRVRHSVESILGGVDDVVLCEPLDYLELTQALHYASLVLTDSGGLQEEAPAFGKPVLVLRESTERPEAVHSGVARLVGTSRMTILNALSELLDDPEAYSAMARGHSPYGDGHAARRVVDALGGEHVDQFVPGGVADELAS